MDLGLHRLGWEIHREGMTFILIPGDQGLSQSGKQPRGLQDQSLWELPSLKE